MNLTLSPELEAFVNQQVESGLYESAQEVVQEGLLLLREQEAYPRQKRAALREAIQAGLDDLDNGRAAPFDALETLARVRQKQQAQAERAG